jgi:AcrR family transcriptional regulator
MGTKATGPDDTRQRILAIARDLFGRQGYTGTTISDIAGRLGTTTAALYYHFRSKSEILDCLLTEPLAAYTRLVEQARYGQLPVDALLEAYIDFTIETREVAPLLAADPSVRVKLDEQLPHKPPEMIEAVVAALAGPHPDRGATIRARAAFAVVKEATLAALSTNDGTLDVDDRGEILAAALRALGRPDRDRRSAATASNRVRPNVG